MNIFVLDRNYKKAAEYHCDKHVVKMIVETAQMLCTVKHLNDMNAYYKATHVNHPCTKWVAQSIQNYAWLNDLGIALCLEYNKRYNKIHKSHDVILDCFFNPPKLSNSGLSEFICAMPDDCKISKDPVINYREYYLKYKSKFAKWKYTKIPDWYSLNINQYA